jgi:methyl-accepting chemotaxis protein
MNSWTISRRIIFCIVTLLVITAAVGGLGLWRLQGLNHALATLADNTLPSILTLRECAGRTRDNIFTIVQYNEAGSAEARKGIEDRIAENRARIDELFRQYESLISDSQDRRLFEEVKRARDAFIAARTPYLQLVRDGKLDEGKQTLAQKVIPAYETTLAAIDALIDHNENLGTGAAKAGKEAGTAGVRIIRIALVLALLVAGFLAWRVVRSINRVLRDLAAHLDQGATQTATAARQVSVASQNLSAGASEQAASVEETSASLEEMSSMIRATADNAEKAKALAAEAHAVAQSGSRTMVEMNRAMAAIDASSAEVAKIVKNIDEIAFQTNILALNAAVEAARAGEAGAGFAVVADEVRSLAQRSAAAAKETAEKIEAAIASSRLGSQRCDKVRESLTQITEKVSSTDTLVGEIATAAREQAQGIEQINIAISQMDQVTQSNSASAEESASAAEELDAQAASLKDMVGQLRQLVGGTTTADGAAPVVTPAAPPPQPRPARFTVSSSPPPVRPPARPHPPKPLNPGQRKAIPMPGDTGPAPGNDDANFKSF